jgi:hypothetical protein
MDAERRLEAMMKMAEKNKSKKRFYKIDAKTCRIVDVIGTGELDIPKEAFINATTDDLIKDQIPELYCRTAIRCVLENGEPITLKLPITIGSLRLDQVVHFRRGRNNRSDGPNTVIAYVD